MRLFLALALFLALSSLSTAQQYVRAFSTVAEMAARNPNDVTSLVMVAGQNSRGDGGGGLYYYNGSSTATPDGVTVVQPVVPFTGRWLFVNLSGSGSVPSSRQISTINSLTGGGSLASDKTLQLVGDSASPGNFKVYGTGPAGSRSWRSETSETIFNVKHFGATGDGTTDDTAAIENANIAADAVNGIVFFPAGTYQAQIVARQFVTYMGTSQPGGKNTGEGSSIIRIPNGAVDGTAFKSSVECVVKNLQIDGNKANTTGTGRGIWFDAAGLFKESLIQQVTVVNCDGDGIYINAHEVSLDRVSSLYNDGNGLTIGPCYDVMADHVLCGWNNGNGFEAASGGATLRITQLDAYYNKGSGVIIRSPLWVYIDRLQCDFNFQNGVEIEVGSTASNIQINYPLIYGSNVDQDNFGAPNPAASGTYSDFVISGTQYPKSIRIDGGKIGNSTASTKKPEYHLKWINSQPGVGFGTRILDVDLDTNSGANTSTGKSTQDTWLTGSWTGRILNHRDGTNVRTVTKESYVYATTDFTTSPVLNILNNYDLVVRSNIFAQGYLTANSAAYSGRGITSDKSGVQIKADTGSTIGMANIGDTFVIQNDVNSNPQISLNTRTGQSQLSGTSTNASGDWIALALKMTLNQSGTAGSRGFRAEMTPTSLGSGSHRPFEYTYSGNTRWTVDHNGRMISTSPSGIGPLTLQSESGTDSRIRIYYSEVLDRDMDLKANLLDVKTLSGGTGATFSLNPSGGSVQLGGNLVFGSGGPIELKGSGSPEGVVTAPVSSTYRRIDGGSSTAFYVKESGSGNTGWIAYGAAGAGGVASSRQILTVNSLTGGGDLSADRTIQLSGDTASPGANKVYGTDGSGVRGWKDDPSGGGGAGYGGTSTSSVSFGTGSKTWTTQTGLAYVVGARVRAIETGFSMWMEGTVTAYSGGTLTVNVDLFSGVGTFSAWAFSIAGVQGDTGAGFVDADYGDILIGSGVTTLTIDNQAVTYSKMQNISAASKLLGRGSAAGAGSPQEITLGTGLSMSGTTLSVTGATVADSDYGDIAVSFGGLNWFIDQSAVTYDKIQDMNHTRILGRKTANGIGAPEEVSVSDILDWTSGASPASGDMLYRSGSSWYRLAAGTPGLFLQTQGTGASPQWAAPTLDPELSAIAGLTSAADTLPYFTGSGTATLADLSSNGRSLISLSTMKAVYDALNGAEATVASATTTDIGAASSDKVSITGTTTITGFGTATAGIRREGRFTGSLTLTHNATSLILPGGSSITTQAGDRFSAYSLGSGNWVVTSYTTASRTGTGADVQQNSPNLTGTPTVNGNEIAPLDILQNSQSANYTLVIGDRGKHIFHPSSDANSRTFTIPANASVAFPIGSTVTFINASASSCTIAITTDTLRKAGTGTTGSVTLPQHAVATITKVTTTEWYISGNGI